MLCQRLCQCKKPMIDELIRRFPLVSDQIETAELRVLLTQLDKTLTAKVPGEIVELGCYTGTAALFLRRLLDVRHEPRELHVYDSFEGLPPKTEPDGSPAGEAFVAGALKASKPALIKHFKQAGLRPPIIHKGWFEELTPDDLPLNIALAFLDGDFYTSIQSSLKLVWPRLSAGGVIIVDDYQAEALPGARRAVDEWLQTHPAKLAVQSSLAIITPVH